MASGAANAATTSVTGTMRPRANTISHIDGSHLNFLMNSGMGRAPGLPSFPSHPNLAAFGGQNNYDFRPMPGFSQHANVHSLPKLETHGLNIDVSGGLRTAPIPGMGHGFDMDKLFGGSSTVNPAQLHFGNGLGADMSPFQSFPPFSSALEDDDSLDWTGGLGDSLMNGGADVNNDGSSPSAISTASQSGFSEVMLDGSTHVSQSSGAMWSNAMMAPPVMSASGFGMDSVQGAVYSDFAPQQNMVSPKELHDQQLADAMLFSTPPPMQTMSPSSVMPGMANQFFHQPMAFNSDSTSISSASLNGSAHQSSITSVSTDSITDATRQALILTLSQPSSYVHTARKYSQPMMGSPLSPGFNARAAAASVSLPSTADLQRYVSAYVHYFHPHMPFLHIATLNFDSPAFNSNIRIHHSFRDGIVGGGGCLILAMAAIGASYEFEHEVGKTLFDGAKRMISIYLEERRQATQSMATNASLSGTPLPPQKTPLWLVQAMLLNLIYGLVCGEKLAGEIATTHCAALVSLAKAAELDKPDPDVEFEAQKQRPRRTSSIDGDHDMMDDGMSPRSWHRSRSTPQDDSEYIDWIRWKSTEERKRTLFIVFILSSLLVTAYNHQPQILNSELHVNLPCEENLWAADSPQAWNALGGAVGAVEKDISFAGALAYLLTASQRPQKYQQSSTEYNPTFGSTVPLDDVPESDLKPSTFGCYVLINALHVYIWETRQRHPDRQWTTQETEHMHAQVEPALRAWQAAWRSNPHHTLERPNPYGPLPADSIPLLDLAYVRLFVNLGASKDAFWARDFEAMAEELGHGNDIIQHAANSRAGSSEPSSSNTSNNTSANSPGDANTGNSFTRGVSDVPTEAARAAAQQQQQPGQSSKRERHLRKAAFYAADSLNMADKLGVTFAEFTSRELPIQAALCSFDCAQVLAEWVSTVQERVGRFLGVLGRDDVDFAQVPAVMLLEEEDCKLLAKVNEILTHAELKISFDAASLNLTADQILGDHSLSKDGGLGSRLLVVTAYMLQKAAVWPSKCFQIYSYATFLN